MTYFDYCATTPLDDRVKTLMHDLDGRIFGNPSSIHRYGQEAKGIVEKARRQIAEAINASPIEIIFTSGGSEANNLILWNLLKNNRKHVILSTIEHPSIYSTVKHLEQFGLSSTIVGVNSQNRVHPKEIRDALQENSGLVTVMTVNNETGTIQPIKEIGEICEEAGVPFHTDAVQALGKIPLNVRELKAFGMSFSAHKLYGPKGVGALYVKKGTMLTPLITGGGQEQSLRAGTENVTGIAGFGLATEIAVSELHTETRRLNRLKRRFFEAINKTKMNYLLHSNSQHQLPGVISIAFPDIPGDALLMNLDLEGYALSNGSACSSGSVQPSRILKAMGISDKLNLSTLRISFGRFTTEEDIRSLVNSLVKHVKALMELDGSLLEMK